MDVIATAFWVGGIASLAIAVLWHPGQPYDRVLGRRIALMGILYLAISLLLSVQ